MEPLQSDLEEYIKKEKLMPEKKKNRFKGFTEWLNVGKKKKPKENVDNDSIFKSVKFDESHMVRNKDRIQSSAKEFKPEDLVLPNTDQIKAKLIAADKYYGTKSTRSAKRPSRVSQFKDSNEGESGKTIERPSWAYISERPLLEQYVLMNNYIRKLSVLAELENIDKRAAKSSPSTSSLDTEYGHETDVSLPSDYDNDLDQYKKFSKGIDKNVLPWSQTEFTNENKEEYKTREMLELEHEYKHKYDHFHPDARFIYEHEFPSKSTPPIDSPGFDDPSRKEASAVPRRETLEEALHRMYIRDRKTSLAAKNSPILAQGGRRVPGPGEGSSISNTPPIYYPEQLPRPTRPSYQFDESKRPSYLFNQERRPSTTPKKQDDNDPPISFSSVEPEMVFKGRRASLQENKLTPTPTSFGNDEINAIEKFAAKFGLLTEKRDSRRSSVRRRSLYDEPRSMGEAESEIRQGTFAKADKQKRRSSILKQNSVNEQNEIQKIYEEQKQLLRKVSSPFMVQPPNDSDEELQVKTIGRGEERRRSSSLKRSVDFAPKMKVYEYVNLEVPDKQEPPLNESILDETQKPIQSKKVIKSVEQATEEAPKTHSQIYSPAPVIAKTPTEIHEFKPVNPISPLEALRVQTADRVEESHKPTNPPQEKRGSKDFVDLFLEKTGLSKKLQLDEESVTKRPTRNAESIYIPPYQPTRGSVVKDLTESGEYTIYPLREPGRVSKGDVQTELSKIINVSERRNSTDTSKERDTSPKKTSDREEIMHEGAERRVSIDRRNSSAERRTSSTEKRMSSSERRPSSAERRPSSAERRSSSDERRPSSSERGPSSSERRPSSSERRPSNSERRPSSSERRPSSSERRPSSSERRYSSSERRPSTSERTTAEGRRPSRLERSSSERRSSSVEGRRRSSSEGSGSERGNSEDRHISKFEERPRSSDRKGTKMEAAWVKELPAETEEQTFRRLSQHPFIDFVPAEKTFKKEAKERKTSLDNRAFKPFTTLTEDFGVANQPATSGQENRSRNFTL